MNDVMSLLIQLEKQAKLKISADKNENGDYIPETVYLKFTNKEVNVAIADYLKMVENNKTTGVTVEKTLSDSNRRDRLMMYFKNQ